MCPFGSLRSKALFKGLGFNFVSVERFIDPIRTNNKGPRAARSRIHSGAQILTLTYISDKSCEFGEHVALPKIQRTEPIRIRGRKEKKDSLSLFFIRSIASVRGCQKWRGERIAAARRSLRIRVSTLHSAVSRSRAAERERRASCSNRLRTISHV